MPATDTSTVTRTQLAERCGAQSDGDKYQHAYDVAKDLLAEVLESARRQPPTSLLNEAVLRAGRVVWDGKKSSSGGGQGLGLTDNVNRPPADPRRTIRIVLADYLALGIA